MAGTKEYGAGLVEILKRLSADECGMCYSFAACKQLKTNEPPCEYYGLQNILAKVEGK